MFNRLVIQLARLGDLLQSLPAIASLRTHFPEDHIDLLCAAPLVPLGSIFPGVRQVLPWDGEEWGKIAESWSKEGGKALSRAADLLKQGRGNSYKLAYNLNNHSRTILASHLLANEVIGPGREGPLSLIVPNWVNYLKMVGEQRGNNRVHLADAFCGICGVNPPSHVPVLQLNKVDGPENLVGFIESDGVRVVLVLGSGDVDRRIPLHVWENWISHFLSACPEGRVMLVGGAGERPLAYTLLDRISPMYVGRIWDASGQTTLPELAGLLSHTDWVIGSDTGPLHLGVACGAKAQGFYFSRARVHETGPYGVGHWVWQAETTSSQREKYNVKNNNEGIRPEYWPVKESVELLLTESCSDIPEGWSVWKSYRDAWGVFYSEFGRSVVVPFSREFVWQQLGRSQEVEWNMIKNVLNGNVDVPMTGVCV